MIRRLQRNALLESIAPRAVRGGVVSDPVQMETMDPVDGLEVQGYRQGYAEGFEAGEQDGRREAVEFHQAWEQETRRRLEEELQSVASERARLSALVAGLEAELRTRFSEMERLAFDLAMAGLSQAFGSMQEDGELIRRLCTQMAEQYRGRAVRLEIAAADREALPEHVEGLDIAVEYALSPGTCRIVTERGYVESAIDARIDAVYDAMRETGDADRS
jgi:flagellar biosynthesis/type III secretory pathway protein FliH